MAELLTKLDPKPYQKYVKREKGITVLYVDLKKIPRWHSTGSTPVLKKFDVKLTGVDVRNKSLRLVRDKQDSRRKTYDSSMACV